tara:strand:- start:543 stop:1934 length:1392 start_codon:yes stop_codon:yes gene_type:complete
VTRRNFFHDLYGLGASLGSVAFTSLLADSVAEDSNRTPRPHHSPPSAKRCIFLYMEGGPSHLDTFDPKPKLGQLHLSEFQRSGEEQSAMSSGKRYYVQSPFTFRQAGDSGAWLNTRFQHLASVADDICFYRGLQGESVNHPTANYHVNTGNRFGGDPALGAWVNLGLGSENSNLPGFVVLPELSFPQGGPANWSNGFLPARFQGTALRPQGPPLLDIKPPVTITPTQQRQNLQLLDQLNRRHAEQRPQNSDLKARMQNYELAFRMQTQVPDLVDLSRETRDTHTLYGIGQPQTDNLGRRCLLARKLVEQGVRFVQLYASTWDSHDYIAKAHGSLIDSVDRPIAGLISDLKQRGLLDDTLVVWMGEFGRTPDNGIRGGIKYGRDHNPNAMAVWLAGGGIKAGHTIGRTDDIGSTAVEVVHPIQDLHVTLLRLLGLDDNRLTFFHAGRFKQLSQFGGEVIEDLIA